MCLRIAYVNIRSLPASCVEIHSHGYSANCSLYQYSVGSKNLSHELRINMGTRSVHDYSTGHQILKHAAATWKHTIMLTGHKMPAARAFVGD